MAKLTLNDITSGYGSNAALNENFALIETALENTLSRDGTTPNSMSADLDMNGHRILNELAQSGTGFTWEGQWTSSTDYVLNNLVYDTGSTYICTVDHTAGTVFATDLAAGKWELIAQQGLPGDGSGDLLAANNLSELTATAATARGNILAAKSGANSDITSLTGLTTPLDDTLGGTGFATYTTGDILYASAANTLSKLAKGTTGQVLTQGASVPSWETPSTATENYIYIRDEKSSGTVGQTLVSTTWTKRDLNTEVVDTGAHASIASSVITLAAGTYRFRFCAPGASCDKNKARLADTTNTTYYYGSSVNANSSYGGESQSVGSGRFTIAAPTTFELQHYVQTGGASTGGLATSIATVNEVYSEIEFWREVA